MKRLLCVALALVLMLGLVGCAKVEEAEEDVKEEVEKVVEDVEEEVEKIVTEVKDDFDTIVADAKAEAEKIETVAEDDVKEAIDYLNEHIAEPFENSEVVQTMIKYANKLISWGERTEEAAKHDIAQVGQKIHNLYETVIKDGEAAASEAVTAIKDEASKLLSDITAAKDEVVSEFCKLIHKD